MNLPGLKLDLPTLTDKDKDDIQNFAVKHKVDFIAASNVRKSSNIHAVRNFRTKRTEHQNYCQNRESRGHSKLLN